MAQFSYEKYAAQQQTRNANSGNGGNNGPEVHFMNEYLKNDGDVAVVRFPYASMADISFETTHAITFPGKKYPSRVRCAGDNCPFCAQGVKLDTRFFAKALVYVVDEGGNIKIINTVWDRPSAFADIDIKNLIQEYGDLSQQLFKIKRNGTGTATRYTISIVMNATVYNPAVYKADFTELNKVDAARILSKSIAQYNEAVNPSAANTTAAPAAASTTMPTMQPVAETPTYTAPATTYSAPNTASVANAPATEAPVETRRQTRYQF